MSLLDSYASQFCGGLHLIHHLLVSRCIVGGFGGSLHWSVGSVSVGGGCGCEEDGTYAVCSADAYSLGA